jgi:predicted ATPase/DNA-binding CsgD family transcriptional regulator
MQNKTSPYIIYLLVNYLSGVCLLACLMSGESKPDGWQEETPMDDQAVTTVPTGPVTIETKANPQAALRTNLSPQFTSFIGRESEIAEIERLVGSIRLLTLVGPGGVGKTRLALETAWHLLPKFSGGVWLVDLATILEPQLIEQAVGLALQLYKEANRPLLSTIIEALQDRQLMLILDNCEHLLAGCAALASALLAACPALSILATSREPLGMGGELIWQVPSLSLPPFSNRQEMDGANPTEFVAQLMGYEAVRLLVHRIQAGRASFSLTPENSPAVAAICQRLDGIPLALELAAARFQLLSAEQVAARLDQTFQLLGKGDRLARPRHQTLRATLDWSYNLLSAKEALFFGRLALFVGDWSLEAAEQICSDELELATDEILDYLAQLVSKSLVVVIEPDQEAHYRLLEIVRQYAFEKLVQTGEMPQLREKALAYYLKLVGSVMQPVGRKELIPWLRRVEKAYPNIRAACEWAVGNGYWEKALQLSAGLWVYWDRRDQAVEGREWLEPLLECTSKLGVKSSRAEALFAYGSLLSHHGDLTQALGSLEESLAIWQQLDDTKGIGLALMALGSYAMYQEDYELSRSRLIQSLDYLAQTDDPITTLMAHGLLALAYLELGQIPEAQKLMEQNLERARALNDPWLLARALTHLEELVRAQGNLTQAQQLAQEALNYFELLNNPNMCAMTYGNLAQIALAQANSTEALTLELKCAHLLVLHQGGHEFICATLAGLAGIVLSQNQPALAARLFGACERYQEKLGVRLQLNELRQYKADLETLRGRLTPTDFASFWAEGRKWSPGQAISQVETFQATLLKEMTLSRPAADSGSPKTTACDSGLSAREQEVLVLLAKGMTNKQIAQTLVISPKTVNRHLEAIFSKLGVNSRSAATRYALEHHLG